MYINTELISADRNVYFFKRRLKFTWQFSVLPEEKEETERMKERRK
jgi:hypothetical protein